MIKCMIVEDEELAQDVIKAHLRRMEQLELVSVCRNAPEALEALQTKEVDLIFLDIRLPGMTGLHFLRSLPDPPLVILTTAYAEYALESYEFSVIDYLLKPISFERFAKAVGKITEERLFAQARRELENREPENKNSDNIGPGYIFIRSNGKFFKVYFSGILYISGMKDYLKVHTQEYTLITHQTMNDMEKELPASGFIRVHRSYIVSIAEIRSISANSVSLANISIPIGVSYRETVRALIP